MADNCKRRRASKPKTKSGCITSASKSFNRIRRVKCDETKPDCLRCQKFGQQCDGYIDLTKRKIERISDVTLLPKPREMYTQARGISLHWCPPITTQPSLSPRYSSDAEYRYFNVFRQRTAAELSGHLDSDVWSGWILRECHEQDFVRHAVVAIGALSAAVEAVQYSHENSSCNRNELGAPHHKFALQQYGKALRLMQALPERGGSWPRISLLSCLLTTCFEIYIGDKDNALVQAQAGLDILLYNDKLGRSGTSDDLCSILSQLNDEESDILGTFARLEAFRLPLREEDSAAFKAMPERFRSIRDARLCWDLSSRRVWQWRETHLQGSSISTLDFGESEVTHSLQKADAFALRVQAELGLFFKAREKWLLAFQDLFQRTRQRPGSKDFLGANIMMIEFLSTKLTVLLSGQNHETYCDDFLQDHIEIVRLAKELFEMSPKSHGKAIFVFDGSNVSALFIVATRCRDRAVRREAINLLQKYPRREGLWDSSMAVKVSTWVMNMEETGMVDGYVPELSRLRIVKTNLSLSERKATIRCSKVMEEGGERVELGDFILKW
ncbi:hypothetical protein N431DRAFT_496710 [Stipitochalara longipes BDJ]|nr:hypothetical protein N431DRAFT_496710 [Stipitochalara longipes BDJ]